MTTNLLPRCKWCYCFDWIFLKFKSSWKQKPNIRPHWPFVKLANLIHCKIKVFFTCSSMCTVHLIAGKGRWSAVSSMFRSTLQFCNLRTVDRQASETEYQCAQINYSLYRKSELFETNTFMVDIFSIKTISRHRDQILSTRNLLKRKKTDYNDIALGMESKVWF